MRSGQDLIWSPRLPAAARFAIFFVSTDIATPRLLLSLLAAYLLSPQTLAGAEGFEPPSSVLETDSLTVELTPLFLLQIGDFRLQIEKSEIFNLKSSIIYFTSLCGVCLRQMRQNFFSSRRSVIVFRFLVV